VPTPQHAAPRAGQRSIWSADLGSFLQPDQYAYLSRGGTLWSWPGQNPFRWRDPSGRDAEEWFLRNSDRIIDASLAISGAAFTIATLGAGWEVGAALAGGRLTLGAAARFGAVGALKGGLLGAGVETGRQLATSDCPPDYGKIGKAAAAGAVAGAVFGARGGIWPLNVVLREHRQTPRWHLAHKSIDTGPNSGRLRHPQELRSAPDRFQPPRHPRLFADMRYSNHFQRKAEQPHVGSDSLAAERSTSLLSLSSLWCGRASCGGCREGNGP
jgi:hypothetical protein